MTRLALYAAWLVLAVLFGLYAAHVMERTWTPAQDRIEALEAEIGRLKNPPDEYCAKCGAPKSNHPYRHPFVSMQKGEPT